MARNNKVNTAKREHCSNCFFFGPSTCLVVLYVCDKAIKTVKDITGLQVQSSGGDVLLFKEMLHRWELLQTAFNKGHSDNSFECVYFTTS